MEPWKLNRCTVYNATALLNTSSSGLYCLSRLFSDWQAHKTVFGNSSNSIRRWKSPSAGCSSPWKNYLSYNGEISQSMPNDHLQYHHILKWNSQFEDWKRKSFEIEEKKHFECRITFHTVDYSASREAKGSPIVLKIQGWWGGIAFRVGVRSGMRTVGCWVNWIHVWNLYS